MDTKREDFLPLVGPPGIIGEILEFCPGPLVPEDVDQCMALPLDAQVVERIADLALDPTVKSWGNWPPGVEVRTKIPMVLSQIFAGVCADLICKMDESDLAALEEECAERSLRAVDVLLEKLTE
jgi:hypothetical protein